MALDQARRVVCESGLEALTARRVAEGIGYTVGTLYQMFRGMDDLVEQMNGETLDRLLDALPEAAEGEPVGDRLMALAQAFIAFARKNHREWTAVITYPYSAGHDFSPAYDKRIEALLGQIASATASLYPDTESERHLREVRTLWSGLYGMFALESSGRLGKGETTARQTETLINLYLDARQDR